MIVVAGLTPAWQQILRFERLDVGEVNRAAESAWCASGKVLNVGIAASRLGAACRTISPVGGDVSPSMRRQCAELGVDVDWIETVELTRVCTTLLDSRSGVTTELVENAKPLSAEELQAYRSAYERAAATANVAVWTGSLPVGTPATFYRDLLDVTSGQIVVDARGPELLELLDGTRRPLIVKPNREELAKTVGRSIDGEAELCRAMHELNDRGAEWVVVTQGSEGVWASSHTGLWKAAALSVRPVVNPIGCGDCLAAGIAVGLDRGDGLIDALRYGIAAASDNLTTLHPARIDRATVERLAETVIVSQVNS
jgi:tagatose 6-phosphate kinase